MKIVVYGASGFQGKLVLAELARRQIETAPAGRDGERLKRAAAQAGIPDAELRVAALGDHEALVAAFGGADVVINCAGPFTPSGAQVIEAAIAAGAHYVDTSGEQPYIQDVYDTFIADAGRAGVTVMPAVTDGGVPGDLVAHLLAERIGPVDQFTAAHRITRSGGMSRGSLRSALGLADVISSGGIGYEGGQWRANAGAAPGAMVFPGESQSTAMVAFPLQEMTSVPRHVKVRSVRCFVEEALSALVSAPITAELIDTLPEGPGPQDRAAQRWTIVVDAVARDGRRARGVIHGPDTYGTTAVIAVEGARPAG